MITIVAHRGASRRAHENTIEAFREAIALGVDMVELDVRKTGDGTLVVFHDPHLALPARSGLLANLTYRELQKRAAKKKFSIPTLAEAFHVLSGKAMADIELKEPGYEQEVVALARRYFTADRFVLASFHPQVIVSIKSESPDCAAALILANTDALAWHASSPADIIAPEKRLFASHRRLFKTAQENGKRVAVWTVDSAALLSALLVDPIVDAIITNYPDRALNLRKKLAGA
ncbi:MAG: glycerophosphodiester phosphodiesterase [Chitinispirillaceae bacterium]|nr:glycerophosphodiester phosphodiesterase [Chitinispirillaceae bacterium]